MTREEAADLRLLADFVRDWRTEDAEWKQRMDERMRSVEGFVTGAMAERRVAARARFSQREKIGLALAVLTFAVGTAVQVVNLLA